MIEGRKVSEMFSLVASYGKEIEALCEALENKLVEKLNSESLPCVISGDAKWTHRMDESDWVCTDVGCSIPLKSAGKGKKKTKAYICFQISMTGEGARIGEHVEPLLHVGLWDEPISFKEGDENFMSSPMEHFEPVSSVQSERLLLWNGDDAVWSNNDWLYSLRLMTINSTEDLQIYVVAPVLALLQEKDVSEALPDEWLKKQLVRYPPNLRV